MWPNTSLCFSLSPFCCCFLLSLLSVTAFSSNFTRGSRKHLGSLSKQLCSNQRPRASQTVTPPPRRRCSSTGEQPSPRSRRTSSLTSPSNWWRTLISNDQKTGEEQSLVVKFVACWSRMNASNVSLCVLFGWMRRFFTFDGCNVFFLWMDAAFFCLFGYAEKTFVML